MTPLLIAIAIALAHAPAVAPVTVCPAEVGQSARLDIKENEDFVKLYNHEPMPWLGRDYNNNEKIRLAHFQGKVVAQRVRLGYAYLDAKCYKEARATFNEVWESNSAEFAPFAHQAREALNAMNSKGQ